MGAVEGIRWEYALDGIFLAFYSVNAASTYVKMLLSSIFTILFIIFELIDKSLVTPENALAIKADENTAKNRFFDIGTGVTSDLSISSKIINKIVKIELNNIFT
jgi:hypothetical protein